jgi:hypothetical protein
MTVRNPVALSNSKHAPVRMLVVCLAQEYRPAASALSTRCHLYRLTPTSKTRSMPTPIRVTSRTARSKNLSNQVQYT